jgi:hypothetical protein
MDWIRIAIRVVLEVLCELTSRFGYDDLEKRCRDCLNGEEKKE